MAVSGRSQKVAEMSSHTCKSMIGKSINPKTDVIKGKLRMKFSQETKLTAEKMCDNALGWCWRKMNKLQNEHVSGYSS